MKKIITFCFFALTMFFGTQNLSAQNQNLIEINTIAFEKTDELRKAIKFDNTQRDKIFEVFKIYQKQVLRIKGDIERQKKIDHYLNEKIKEILNEEQFEIYKNLNQ